MTTSASRRPGRRHPRVARWHDGLRGQEQGAALVEFAIVLPVMLMLVLGMISGGTAYDRKQTLTQASREATRFGATLPVNPDLTTWLTNVGNVAVDQSLGNLDAGVTSRYVCVALVGASGNNRRIVDGAAAPAYSNGTCFSDGLSGQRVQVLTRRTTDFDAMLIKRSLTLTGKSTARFEAGT